MPRSVADHVAAVALFGTPSPAFMSAVGEPAVTIGPLYATKATQLCVPGDPVCSTGSNMFFHGQYVPAGLVSQAAAFVASRV
jgi:cutinase